MQKLIFESAWDKTIAPEDRLKIETLFNETKNDPAEAIKPLPISQAYNHKEDLLVIVLIHNFTDKEFTFDNLDVVYKEGDKEIAAHHFTFSNLKLPEKTSMPWTFIFPKGTQISQAKLNDGTLIIN
ncbi:SLAP domain-containing protein [Oceanobacillus sp. CAU 1775]